MLNHLCDNTMVLDKFFMAQLLSLMMDVEVVNFAATLDKSNLSLENGIFVLDNTGRPYTFCIEHTA